MKGKGALTISSSQLQANTVSENYLIVTHFWLRCFQPQKWHAHPSAPVSLPQLQYRPGSAPVLWVQVKPATPDSTPGSACLAPGVLSGYSMSSLGIGSPLRPASKLLAANKDMVFRVPWVALPM